MSDRQRYLVALGSNMRHAAYGSPRKVLEAAFAALGEGGDVVLARSPILRSAPLGPSKREYCNAAALVETALAPDAYMAQLLEIEERFGRKRRGGEWRSRVLDLDIVLWNAGAWASDDGELAVIVPHPSFRERDFVLRPAVSIAGDWRDPLSGLTTRHLSARLTKPRHRPR